MKLNKFALLAAAAAGAVGTTAQAQVVFPAATINGAGATLIANVQRQSFDCIGTRQALAFNGKATPLVTTTADFLFFTPATVAPPYFAGATLGNRFNCAGNTQVAPISPVTTGSPGLLAGRIVQPNITALYIGVGSGAGIASWQNHSSPEAYPGSAVVLPLLVDNGNGDWPSYGAAGVQFANSDNALTFAQVSAYNTTVLANAVNESVAATATTAQQRYGNAIQIPLYVAPVALSYSRQYASEADGSGNVTNYLFTVGFPRADASGGLRLTRAQYCGIMTGRITNWNRLATTVLNKDPADTSLNWATTGLPINLIGRSDSSGTTSLFTRAIAAQCNQITYNTGVNNTGPAELLSTFGGPAPANPFQNASGTLPAGVQMGVTFTKGLTPSFSGPLLANGKYALADGNDGVAQAIFFQAVPAPSTRTINGKLGYLAPDLALPATALNLANTYGLQTASLQAGTTATFVAPTAKEASKAFSGVFPPQSTSTGAYCLGGGSAVCQTNIADGASAIGNRANPLDWVFPGNRFLINTTTGATLLNAPNPIAAPIKGYPIVGTSNVLLYTCYQDKPTRMAITNVWGTFLGKVTKDYNNQTMPATLISNATVGLLARNGFSPLPTPWINAITETFFKRSTQNATVPITLAVQSLGSQNFWISSNIPTALNTASTTNPSFNNSVANPLCAGIPGA